MYKQKSKTAVLLQLRPAKPLSLLALVMMLGGLALCPAHGQALPAATRQSVEVGAAYSVERPDYGFDYIQGLSVFGNVGLPHRFGIAVDMHFQNVITPNDIGESMYLVGPRFDVLRQDRFRAYVKVQGGIGRFLYEPPSFNPGHTDSYKILGLGGGFEYRASRHINIRALDIEAESWPGYPPNGLTPVVVSFGAAYIP